MIMQGASADEVMKVIDDRTYRNFGNKKEKKDTVIRLPETLSDGAAEADADEENKPDGGDDADGDR